MYQENNQQNLQQAADEYETTYTVHPQQMPQAQIPVQQPEAPLPVQNVPVYAAPQPAARQVYAAPPAPGYMPYAAYYEMQAHAAAKKSIRRDAGYVSFAALAMYGFSSLLTAACVFFGVLTAGGKNLLQNMNYGGMSQDMYYLMLCVATAVGTPLMFWVFAKARRYDFNDLLRFRKTGFLTGVLCVLLGFGACMAANVPAWMISDWMQGAGFQDVSSALPAPQSVFSAVTYAVAIAVLPPIAEEFAFRGVVLGSLRKYGDGVAILVSAVIFGLVHGNFVQTPFAFIAGLAMGFVYVRTNNLLVPIAVHFLNNGVSVLLEYLGTAMGEAVASAVNEWMFWGAIAAAAVSVLVLFLKDRTFFRPKKHSSPEILSFSQRLGAATGNFGFISLAVISLVMCVLAMVGLA